MNNFREKLLKNEFVVTAELCPPKGPDMTVFREKARLMKGLVDAVNITDNQRAIMRMCALAGARIAQEEGLDPILQFTCRDRNRIGIQSDLLGAAGFGISNVLALTGDYVSEGDHIHAKGVYDLDSTLLIKAMMSLNDGLDLSGKKLNAKTDFFIGAAMNPCAEPPAPHRLSFERKIASGARFFQTQVIFEMEKFAGFMEYAKEFPVKIIAGVLLVKSVKMALFLNDNVPGVHVPDDIIKKLEGALDPLKAGIEIARGQINELRSICHGVHLMTIGHEERIIDILK